MKTYTVVRETWINNARHTPGDPETGTVTLHPKSAEFYLNGGVIVEEEPAPPAKAKSRSKARAKAEPETVDEPQMADDQADG